MAAVWGLAQQPQLMHLFLELGPISSRKLPLLPVILPSALLLVILSNKGQILRVLLHIPT